jgi:hypothetical protein
MGYAHLYTMDCPQCTSGQDYYPITNEKFYDIGPTKSIKYGSLVGMTLKAIHLKNAI